jgi:hypothetical protein
MLAMISFRTHFRPARLSEAAGHGARLSRLPSAMDLGYKAASRHRFPAVRPRGFFIDA